MSGRQRVRDPWTVTISHRIQYVVFWQLFRVFQDLPWSGGIAVRSTMYKDSKRQNKYKTCEIEFTSKKRALDLLNRFNIRDQTWHTKTIKKSGLVASLIINGEKPMTMWYSATTEKVTLKLHYKVVNEYGIELS